MHRNRPLNILISNDDGLFSNGLLHLENELRTIATVYSIAPDRERSATSQALSIRETLRVEKESDFRFSVSGFPVDCVNVAIHLPSFPSFDLVVSGINHGENLGDDVHYSGTVGAARHAAIHGYRAIAISCPIREADGDFRRVARWLRTWIEAHLEELEYGIVYNINYPAENFPGFDDPLPGFEFTNQGRRIYNDEYQVLEEGQNRVVLKLKETVMGFSQKVDTDFYTVQKGLVSITPLKLDTTEREEMDRWKRSMKQNAKK